MVWMVFERDYDGCNIYGIYEDYDTANMLRNKLNDERYQDYLDTGSPATQEVKRRESDLKMIKRQSVKARGRNGLEHAQNQLAIARQRLAEEKWKPIPKKNFEFIRVHELPLNEQIDDYLV